MQKPEGPSTQYSRTLVPKAIRPLGVWFQEPESLNIDYFDLFGKARHPIRYPAHPSPKPLIDPSLDSGLRNPRGSRHLNKEYLAQAILIIAYIKIQSLRYIGT